MSSSSGSSPALAPAGLTPATWAFYVTMFLGTLVLSYLAAEMFLRLPYAPYLTGSPESGR